MNTGELIQLHRKKKGISLAELANKVGVSKQSISLYERSLRTPSVSNAMKICSALNISFDELNSTLPISQGLPLSVEVDKKPELAINTQTEIYVDEEDRKYILFMDKILSALNYDITISKDTVIIDDLKKEKHSYPIYVNLDDFITISYTTYFMNNGLIETLKNKARK